MTKTATQRGREPGRYDLRGVSDFPVAQPLPSLNVRVAIAGVTDPYRPKKRQKVAINRNTDVLEHEFSYGRISPEAYRYGRELQAVFERGTGVSGRAESNFAPRDYVDRAKAREHMIAAKCDNARYAHDTMAQLQHEVGAIGAQFLRRVLTGETNFAAEAQRAGAAAVPNKLQCAVQAGRFRLYLEGLAEARLAAQTARGRAR